MAHLIHSTSPYLFLLGLPHSAHTNIDNRTTTMDGYEKQVEEFLDMVETIDVNTVEAVQEQVGLNNEIQVNEDDGSDENNSPTTGTATSESQKEKGKAKSNRFHWPKLESQQTNNETKETKIIHVFLHNKNYVDLVYSERIVAMQPYRAPYKCIEKQWKEFHECIVKAQDPTGKTPLAKLPYGSVRKRYENYTKNLLVYVLDKTGFNFPDYTEDEDCLDKPYKDMTVAEKIAHNVLAILTDFHEMEEEEKKTEKEKAEAAEKEERGLTMVKEAGVGKLIAMTSLNSFDSSDIEPSVTSTGKSTRKSTPTTVEKRKPQMVNDFNLDRIVSGLESVQTKTQDGQNEALKRKFEEIQERNSIEREKIEFETKRWASEEENRKMVLQFQMSQASMEATHRKDVLELEKYRLKTQEDMDLRRMKSQEEMEIRRMSLEEKREENQTMMMRMMSSVLEKLESKK